MQSPEDRSDRDVSTTAAFVGMGMLFACLLAVGLTTAALFAPAQTHLVRSLSLTDLALVSR